MRALERYVVGMTDTVSGRTATELRTDPGERVAALAGALQAIMDFYLANPDVPAPTHIQVNTWADSRAELDGLAGDFDQEPPKPATHYRGAQFTVQLAAEPIRTSVLIAYHEGPL